MNPPTTPRRNWLPLLHERVAFANILLLCGLPLLFYLGHLLAVSSTLEVNFPRETATALLACVAVSFAVLQIWRRCSSNAAFRVRLDQLAALPGRCREMLVASIRRRPLAAIWLTALAGVLVSCYPVVFGGKSFVAANSMILLNNPADQDPALKSPGANTHRTDLGAMMWQTMPFSVSEHRAIFHDHELPLWNRYDAGGLPLLGQGLSMLGDPLHWPVIAAGGSAWAWDVKFLLTRLLFAAGIGLCVRAATGRITGALVMTFSACFLGFFIYRLNHPAQFALCYAPWVLYAWLSLVRGRRTEGEDVLPRWRSWRWAALLLLSCWMVYNSGTVKEPVILLLGLNATGVLALLMHRGESWRWKGTRLAQAAWAGVCLVLLSAPMWRTFLEALAHSWNSYQEPRAWQLQPGLLLGLFDDIFYRQFNAKETVLDPSANFMVLLGVAFVVPACRSLARKDRVFVALGVGALAALAVVFGVVPAAWICQVPFLANVTHIDNSFSCVLLVLLPVLAGYGLESLRGKAGSADFAWEYGVAAAAVLLPMAAFLGLAQAGQRSDFSPLSAVGGTLQLSPFFRGYTAVLLASCLAVPLLLRWWRRAGIVAAWGVVPWLAVCAGAMLWRGGLHQEAVVGWESYVMHPGEREDLRAHTPAVERLLAETQREPATCLGFNLSMMGGFISIYGLESPICSDALQNPYYRELQDRSPAPRIATLFAVAPETVGTTLGRLYDLFNVRYYGGAISSVRKPPAEVRGLRFLGRYDLDLYESPTAWPRAFFTDALIPCGQLDDFYAALCRGDRRPFAAVVPQELRTRPDAAALGAMLHEKSALENRAIIPATGYRLTSRTTTFHLQTPGPGVAVLTEGYQTPYKAQVYLDGQPVPHFRTNWAFTGIHVPTAGEHEVRVVYGARDLGILLGASALGLSLLAGTAAVVLRKEKAAAPTGIAGNPAAAADGRLPDAGAQVC